MSSSSSNHTDRRSLRRHAAAAVLGFALALAAAGSASALAPTPAPDGAEAARGTSAVEQGLLPTPPRPALAPFLGDVDMRDDGYNSEYIFGMTKGVASSTLNPALKPLCFLVTVPLDLVFLPFAAIGGFF